VAKAPAATGSHPASGRESGDVADFVHASGRSPAGPLDVLRPLGRADMNIEAALI